MPELFHCEQGSEEWIQLRLGIPTASEFGTVLAKSPGGKSDGKTRATYLRKLAGEIITGTPKHEHTNEHFERGKLMEDEARRYYAFKFDAECDRVGFIKDESLRTGCSPDSLIGTHGGLEIKSALSHIVIELIEDDKFPGVHKPQTFGNMWITGRKWWDLFVYHSPELWFCKRAFRDDDYIGEIAKEVARFNSDLDALVARVRRYYDPNALKAELRASVEAA